jgi:hypothetical protein
MRIIPVSLLSLNRRLLSEASQEGVMAAVKLQPPPTLHNKKIVSVADKSLWLTI